jgi:hypothetical protein
MVRSPGSFPSMKHSLLANRDQINISVPEIPDFFSVWYWWHTTVSSNRVTALHEGPLIRPDSSHPTFLLVWPRAPCRPSCGRRAISNREGCVTGNRYLFPVRFSFFLRASSIEYRPLPRMFQRHALAFHWADFYFWITQRAAIKRSCMEAWLGWEVYLTGSLLFTCLVNLAVYSTCLL